MPCCTSFDVASQSGVRLLSLMQTSYFSHFRKMRAGSVIGHNTPAARDANTSTAVIFSTIDTHTQAT
jgi:hypothetical protein